MFGKLASKFVFRTVLAGVAGTTAVAFSKRAQFDGEQVSTARHAICIMYPAENSEAFGIISFSQEDITSPTKIVAGVRGLNPNSSYGLQLLEYGDLTEGAQSLGKSYASISTSSAPSAPSIYYKHAGDLGNVMTNEKGAGYSAFTNTYTKLFGENNVYGRSCAIFSETNDMTTSMNQGSLLAAGVIGRSSAFKNLPPS